MLLGALSYPEKHICNGIGLLSGVQSGSVASLAVSNHFGSLKGCCSNYQCFCTSHATLHRAHTRKEPLVEKLCRKQGFVFYGVSDLAKVVIGRRGRGRGRGSGRGAQ